MQPEARDEARVRSSQERLQTLGFSTDTSGLVAALSSSNMAARAEAAFILGRRNSRAATTALRSALKDESARVRVEAALALARLGRGKLALGVLREELSGEFFADAPLRAARALALLGEPSGFTRVRDALSSPFPSNRLEAVAVLPAFAGFSGQEVDGQVVDVVGSLLEAATDSEEIIRRDALTALSEFGDPRVLPALQRAAADSRSGRSTKTRKTKQGPK